MGKLRVHNIEAQTGTNVDLGAAGDNVTIASDSIQTNLYNQKDPQILQKFINGLPIPLSQRSY